MAIKGLARPVHRSIPVPRTIAVRLQAVVASVGEAEAARRLGVGKMTLEHARDRGALLRSTFDRLVESLERAESELGIGLRVGT